tara:strand:- start:220 stop:870 length:651 start_codon:yes stop_codon:yes gene_type:complete
MSNSQVKKTKFLTPEKAAILFPTIISSVVALILFSAFAIPKYVSSNRVNNELKEYKRKANELANLKIQAQMISEKLEKLNEKKSKIIRLISGTSNLETFIARLGSIGEKNNINFQEIEPISSTKFVESSNSEIQNELNILPDQFLVEGVKKYTIDLKLNAEYKDLLSFLRELEFQENIILFKDINLELLKDEKEDNSKDNRADLSANLKLVVYGKI